MDASNCSDSVEPEYGDKWWSGRDMLGHGLSMPLICIAVVPTGILGFCRICWRDLGLQTTSELSASWQAHCTDLPRPGLGGTGFFPGAMRSYIFQLEDRAAVCSTSGCG